MDNILGGNIGKWSDFSKAKSIPVTIYEGLDNTVVLLGFVKYGVVQITASFSVAKSGVVRFRVEEEYRPRTLVVGSFACNTTSSDAHKLIGFELSSDGTGYLWISTDIIGNCYATMSYPLNN